MPTGRRTCEEMAVPPAPPLTCASHESPMIQSRFPRVGTASLALFTLAACGDTTEERAATGALRGAVTGAVVGGPAGAAVGAAVGAATSTAVGEALDADAEREGDEDEG